VWLDALPAQAITVLWDDDAAGGGDSWVEVTPDGNFQTHRSPDGFGDFLSNGTVSVAAWTHFVLTIDAGGKTLYINGVLDATTNALPGDPRTGRSYVTLCANYDGNFNPGGPHYFDGTLDEVAIYDHSLTADEVGAHFGAACPM